MNTIDVIKKIREIHDIYFNEPKEEKDKYVIIVNDKWNNYTFEQVKFMSIKNIILLVRNSSYIINILKDIGCNKIYDINIDFDEMGLFGFSNREQIIKLFPNFKYLQRIEFINIANVFSNNSFQNEIFIDVDKIIETENLMEDLYQFKVSIEKKNNHLEKIKCILEKTKVYRQITHAENLHLIKLEQLRREEEERLRKEEEERLRREEEERIRKEQERIQREEEERIRKEQERIKREEERIRKEQERIRIAEEERIRKEQERIRIAEEERIRKEQERIKREEEEERIRKEQERIKREEEEERIRKEQERIQKEEEERIRKEQERIQKEEEERIRKEQERIQKEEEESLRRAHEERLRKEEQERLRREEEMRIYKEQCAIYEKNLSLLVIPEFYNFSLDVFINIKNIL
jgi:hypothetical protein